jgi:hypothetical protein
VIPWSDAERFESDRDEARDETELRALFERRARAIAAPRVPPLAEVLRGARARERPALGARLVAGAALAAACFTAVVYGHRGDGWVEVGQARAEEGIDGGVDRGVNRGVNQSGVGGAIASWGWRADDVTCSADGVRPRPNDETLACFSPRAARQAFTPVLAAPVRIASDNAPSCPLDEGGGRISADPFARALSGALNVP